MGILHGTAHLLHQAQQFFDRLFQRQLSIRDRTIFGGKPHGEKFRLHP